jgi:hypothetical protein
MNPTTSQFAFGVEGSGRSGVTSSSSSSRTGADLTNANLSDANLSGAFLGSANLSYAKGVINEQLSAASYLEGATMPTGQKYEDWLGTPEGQDWLRNYKKDFGADKKREGAYEYWITTTEGKMWVKVIGQDGEKRGHS